MPDLIAKPALGHAPVMHAGTTLAEADWTPIHSIAPFPGQTAAVSAGLAPLGLSFPQTNRWIGTVQRRIVWTGREQAFLFGAAPPAGLAAATTDQSDAWVMLHLAGTNARSALARLVSLDLRHTQTGEAARTALNHMPLILITEAPDSFHLLTFRSMAQTAWHELAEALVKIEARQSAT